MAHVCWSQYAHVCWSQYCDSSASPMVSISGAHYPQDTALSIALQVIDLLKVPVDRVSIENAIGELTNKLFERRQARKATQTRSSES